ncbi:uncharacterized protein Dwil_GK19035 [Drosophila willistoni]|uniref:Uncharacterized protein n=1 Tax=Drosophila willistoni TaxID=7260 RepID=B4MUF8_DROWI|nr:uncharacterized protein LOC6642095 [Drosophila willistoni]EDW76084.1 uncharacterized protein Dwil_GK19035 [Drosophila willistoni]
MPETRIKKLCVTPSTGHHNDVEASASLTNRNLGLPVQANAIRIQNPNRNREPRPRGQRNATEFTASQEVKLKAGDVRIDRMKIAMTKLRTEMEASNKMLQELCSLARIDVDKME